MRHGGVDPKSPDAIVAIAVGYGLESYRSATRKVTKRLHFGPFDVGIRASNATVPPPGATCRYFEVSRDSMAAVLCMGSAKH